MGYLSMLFKVHISLISLISLLSLLSLIPVFSTYIPPYCNRLHLEYSSPSPTGYSITGYFLTGYSITGYSALR
ncbi:hypothetical protein B484DRAFT_460303 [Ochromonadaceae sp. CCMP2298]|nr:hypothetical protein B484DRAFT_460303 [Ochromonadaceae sp. CCMP2298]